MANPWKRKEVIGDCTLYLGDCRDILPTLPKVDAVIADIPYGTVNRKSGGLRCLDKREADIETFDLPFVIRESSRISDSVYIWCGTEQVSELRGGFDSNGMTTRMCGWEKSNPSPMNGEHLWLSSFECCVFARRSNAYFAAKCVSPIWRGPIEREQQHPTQKPIWLIANLVRVSVPEEGSCVDFCMGSGTTLVACASLGRSATGIEIDETHFETACRRIRRAYEDQSLLTEIERPKETQPGLFRESA